MKPYALLLAALLIVACMTGCTKRPVRYKPQNAIETNIMTFMKAKVPQYVVVEIVAPKKAPTMAPGMRPLVMPYIVKFADPKDDTMRTGVPVYINDATQQVDEASFREPAPPSKVEAPTTR